MFTTTKQDLLNRLPETWARQYDEQVFGIHAALLAEGAGLTEARAAEIIGNDSWTRNECNECKQDCPVTVTLGNEDEYDSTATVCLACLQKAVQLVS